MVSLDNFLMRFFGHTPCLTSIRTLPSSQPTCVADKVTDGDITWTEKNRVDWYLRPWMRPRYTNHCERTDYIRSPLSAAIIDFALDLSRARLGARPPRRHLSIAIISPSVPMIKRYTGI